MTTSIPKLKIIKTVPNVCRLGPQSLSDPYKEPNIMMLMMKYEIPPTTPRKFKKKKFLFKAVAVGLAL
jgi:hypothetical protein